MTSTINELEQLLLNISSTSEPIPFSRLYAFSDLSRERLDRFHAVWDTLDASQRRRILGRMAELSEASFRVSFGPIFRHSLDDPDDLVRATAIGGLWEDDSPDLIGPFIRLLRTDPSVRVRAAAAEALGRFVLAGELEQLEPAIQQRIVTELLTVLHIPGESIHVRRRAIESVAYACTDEVGDALQLAYDDDDEALHVSAILGMGRSCDRRWKTVILRELDSLSAAMRYEAALACGELGLRDAVPTLSWLVRDPDREISVAAIWALGQIRGSEARQALIAAYDHADEHERRALDDALAEHALSSGDLDFALQGLEGFDQQVPSPHGYLDLNDIEDDDLPDPDPGAADLDDWYADDES